jgi:riboflavin kinase/FMN adenylyltransferase
VTGSLAYRPGASGQPVVVLGEFDGFHLGHRQLLDAAARTARVQGRPLAAVVLSDQSNAQTLTPVEERCWALLASGASSAFVVTLDPGADSAVGARVVDEIAARLDPACVVMACLPSDHTDARFPELRVELNSRSIPVIEVPRWCNPDGQLITSSAIRDALHAGDIARANDCLGRTYSVTGTVVHGSGLGRTIGFPTANLDLASDQLVPKHGVYAAEVDLPSGDRHRAAVNIGVRPTVESDGTLVVEAHLLDFDADLYDQRITVGFRRWLRNEHRFDSVDALVAQLAADVEQTRLVLRNG